MDSAITATTVLRGTNSGQWYVGSESMSSLSTPHSHRREISQERDLAHQVAAADPRRYIDETLSVEVLETMNKQADEAIASIVDQLVDEQVAACLATHIPQELQDQVAEQQKELEELHRDLHNSESRRANAALRTSHEDDSLNTILKQDCTDLMTEYEIPLVSDSREWNLNRLMQFLGVKYQMVRDGPATTGMGFA
ncbi:unnamed protein product [Mycena citricolor]|uniref:Uncharacterized protein n=1 Tax=Mycena citricolor TaxID=2018698 RepID=A0AAD2GY67_9AGAR|nr:unnamed protein product [Mycena citricolor]